MVLVVLCQHEFFDTNQESMVLVIQHRGGCTLGGLSFIP